MFILNRSVNIEETRYHEFKEIKGQDPVSAIKNQVDEYAVAFLNSDGGRIFWGIRNGDRVVVGVNLTYKQRDELRRMVVEKLVQIQPAFPPSEYRIELHKTYNEENSSLFDRYVVEVVVPRGDPHTLYFTGGNEAFVKTDAGKKKLTGPEIRAEILAREHRKTLSASSPLRLISSASIASVSTDEAHRFLKGFEATWPCIKDGVPVDRTCYTTRKKSVLDEAARLDTRFGLSAYVIVGPRAVGKRTVAKQIAFDLSASGHVVAWLDARAIRLNQELQPVFASFTASKTRTHLFLEIAQTVGIEEGIACLALMLREAGDRPRLSIYLIVDSNNYETFNDELIDVLGLRPTVITVPLNLDEVELSSLIEKLQRWHALGRLAGKSTEEIKRTFQCRAHKILLIALMEALSGTDKDENLDAITKKGVVLKLRACDRPMPGNLKRGQFDLGHVLFVVPQFCPKLRFENLVEGHLQPVEQTRLRPAPSHPLDPVVHLAKGILNGVGGQRYDFAVG